MGEWEEVGSAENRLRSRVPGEERRRRARRLQGVVPAGPPTFEGRTGGALLPLAPAAVPEPRDEGPARTPFFPRGAGGGGMLKYEQSLALAGPLSRASMVRRIRTTPRKEPAQERSRVTYDAIVAATARVLVKDGYDALTTNRVAREAGVSVGSLYQYFPGKEALVAAVMEQHAARMQAHIEERLLHVGASGPLEAATEMIRAMLEAQRKEPRLHRALAEQVPRIGALRRLHELYGRYERLIAAWMEANRDHIEVKDVEIAAFVLVAAVEGLVNRVLLDRPELVSTGKIEEHILRLALAYVAPSLVARVSAEGGLAGKSPA